ncbi:MAG: hypothetical protein JOY80_01585 [Candidatus Dormibacteraeota bacterium]|nr:hypothetical protein [Candidatus Dormibacteraeota bacterium]
MAAMPPQPPGGGAPQPPGGGAPQPPSVSPSGPPQPQTPSTAPQPPATPSSPTPAGTYASQTPQPAYAGAYAAPAATYPARARHRTGGIAFAQVLIIIKGIFWALLGIGLVTAGVLLLVNGSRLSSLPGFDRVQRDFNVTLDAAVTAILFVPAVVALIFALVDFILGVVVGRPSNIARWFIIVLAVLTGIEYAVDLIRLLGLSNVFTDLALLILFIIVAAQLAFNVIIFYILALSPRSRRAFAGTL